MVFKFFALLLLVMPVIHANIHVNIIAADDLAHSSVGVTGSNVDIISDSEMNTFHLSKKNLKKAVHKLFGKQPNDVYVKNPTPRGDLFKRFNVQQVTRIIAPQRSTIPFLISESIFITSQKIRNHLSKPITYTLKMHKSVANNVSFTWRKDSQIRVSQVIEYNINNYAFSAGGETSFKLLDTVTVGSKNGVAFKLGSHQSVIAELYTTRRSMTVMVEYETSLSGRILASYEKFYRGHRFWGILIISVMKAGNLPSTKKSTKIINLNYYSDFTIVVRDAITDKILYNIPNKVYKSNKISYK